MKNWTKALMLSALLFSGSAIAKEKDAQTELEEQGMFYWAQKPAQCSGSDTVIDLLKRHGENPSIWMEGITGFPNGSFNKSKFVIAINHDSNPVTWSLVEFVDDGKQACILGFGKGAINIGNIPLKQKGIDL